MLKHLLEWCDMGGYGIYVLPSYAFLLVIISWQLFAAIQRNRKIHVQLKQNLWSGSGSDNQTNP